MWLHAALAEPRMLARVPRSFTVEGATVVAPGPLHDALRGLGSSVVEPDAVMDRHGLCWRETVRGKPLVLVGNIGNNRALLPLYSAFLDVTDAYHPGGDGFVVRKLLGPQCVLVLGGSTDAGTRRAVEHYRKASTGPTTVELGGDAVGRISRSIQGAKPGNALNAWLFMLRGEKRFADAALAQLRGQVGGDSQYFIAREYLLELLARGYRILSAHGAVSPDDMLFFDNAWLRTLIADQDEYWRPRDGRYIGGRHQNMGVSAFHLIVRMLLQDGHPNDEARAVLEQW